MREPVVIGRNAVKDPRFKIFNNLPEDRYEAFLSVPIVVPPDRVIGVINVQHRKPHRYSDRKRTLLSIIGHQVGGAIENARLYEETRRRNMQLSTLSQVSQIAASGRYLDEMPPAYRQHAGRDDARQGVFDYAGGSKEKRVYAESCR